MTPATESPPGGESRQARSAARGVRRRMCPRQGPAPHHSPAGRGNPAPDFPARAMKNPVDYAISHARLTISVLLFLLVAGLSPTSQFRRRPSPTSRCRSST
jgi:hypothetical protein